MVCKSAFVIMKDMGYFTLLDCKLVCQAVVAERIKSLSFHLGTYPRSNASGLKRLAWLCGFAGQFENSWWQVACSIYSLTGVKITTHSYILKQ